MNVILNPDYKLKFIEDRAIIYSSSLFSTSCNGEEGWESILHPLHAMIFSFFNGENYIDSLKKASMFFNVPYQKISELTDKLIDNESNYLLKAQELDYIFPKRCLISIKPNEDFVSIKHSYNPDMFNYNKLDLRKKRHSFPLDIHLMVNTECTTNCIYCYANRKKIANPLKLSRIFSLIKEARENEARAFEITGGDFFLYRHWFDLLKELHKNGFEPLLSTKTPLNIDSVNKLSQLKIKKIQFSLDSVTTDLLKNVLLIKNSEKYLSSIKQMFYLLEDKNIMIDIHSIITNHNAELNNLNSLFLFLKEHNNINDWRIDNAHSSLYKSDEENRKFLISKDEYESIITFLNSLNNEKDHSFKIYYDSDAEKDEYTSIAHFNNQKVLCSGNYSNLVILPDGDVTICEQLYWHPRFLIGNVVNSSISEVWKSKKALNLYKIKQKEIRGNSPCSSCFDFEVCHEYKHICWLNAIKAYGNDNWDYPDPDCPKAPAIESYFSKQF